MEKYITIYNFDILIVRAMSYLSDKDINIPIKEREYITCHVNIIQIILVYFQ